MAGWSTRAIMKVVRKTDGTAPTQQAVAGAIASGKKKGARKWSCEEEHAGGRPLKTSRSLDKKIKNLVFRHRGKIVVTVAFIRKRIREARKITRRTLQRRLCDAGLAWLHAWAPEGVGSEGRRESGESDRRGGGNQREWQT